MKKQKQFYISAYGSFEERIANAAATFGWERTSDTFFGKKSGPVVHFADESDEAKEATGPRVKEYLFNCVEQYCLLKKPFVIFGNLCQTEQTKIKAIIEKSSISGVIVPDAFMENFEYLKAWFISKIMPQINEQNALLFVHFQQTFNKVGKIKSEHKYAHDRSIFLQEWDADVKKLRNEYLELLEKEMSFVDTAHCMGGSKFSITGRDFGLTKIEITDPFVDVSGITSVYKSLDFLEGEKKLKKKRKLWIYRQEQFLQL
jgi:hypothetical protein